MLHAARLQDDGSCDAGYAYPILRYMLQLCSLILSKCADGSGHLAPLLKLSRSLCSNNRVVSSVMLLRV